ncbi:MAG: DUF1697 domain-containing protein [Erysipelotrichaceae bacterium]|nr:DUF1697 domain-containing protein [Erysipelotrichaceae bacterium]
MKYVALLRGINISGKNKIAMSELKKVMAERYENVTTHLNSGNVIFDCDSDEREAIRNDIHQLIADNFQLDIPVFVITADELEDLLDHAPKWWATADKKIYDNLIFLIPPTVCAEVYGALGEPKPEIEKVEEYANSIFWSFDLDSYRKSDWWVRSASTDIRDKITIRTANTMKKVLEICRKQK